MVIISLQRFRKPFILYSSFELKGITSATRRYTESGIEYTQTDGRGNTTTTVTDIAERTISTTDAAGNTTTTAYCACCDNPALITDPLGNTTCYRYDERGRKVAEWGTAVQSPRGLGGGLDKHEVFAPQGRATNGVGASQPALFTYDDADRMTTLTTFRAGTETISADPAERTEGDVTTWTYHDATGLETAKTYADGHGTAKTYDAYNRLATLTNARGTVQTNTYQPLTGLLTGMAFSDDTTPQSFAYNFLGQLTQVTDAADTRTYAYDAAARPTTRSTARQGSTQHDTFTHNSRSELTAATLGADSYAYDYDNIGNRKTAQELAEETTYTANALNQYTAINDFTPEYDLDGNQTRIKTSTGIWLATYNALTRAVSAVQEADGVYQVITTARNIAAGVMLGSTRRNNTNSSVSAAEKQRNILLNSMLKKNQKPK